MADCALICKAGEKAHFVLLISGRYEEHNRLMKKRMASYILLAVALLFIIVGTAQGGYRDTFNRAATICLECIGIG